MATFLRSHNFQTLARQAKGYPLLSNVSISVLQMAEQAKAQMQQTVARLTDTCWDKCIGTPGGSSSRELLYNT